jgi:hypothetical protein
MFSSKFQGLSQLIFIDYRYVSTIIFSSLHHKAKSGDNKRWLKLTGNPVFHIPFHNFLIYKLIYLTSILTAMQASRVRESNSNCVSVINVKKMRYLCLPLMARQYLWLTPHGEMRNWEITIHLPTVNWNILHRKETTIFWRQIFKKHFLLQ